MYDHQLLLNGKGYIVYVISTLYVVVATLSVSLAEEAVNCGLSINTSCSGANTVVVLTYLSWSCLHWLWVKASLVFICGCKALIWASSCASNAGDSVL